MPCGGTEILFNILISALIGDDWSRHSPITPAETSQIPFE
jgi:hypothetical protein